MNILSAHSGAEAVVLPCNRSAARQRTAAAACFLRRNGVFCRSEGEVLLLRRRNTP